MRKIQAIERDKIAQELKFEAEAWLSSQLAHADTAQKELTLKLGSEERARRFSEPIRQLAQQSFTDRITEIELLLAQLRDVSALGDEAMKRTLFDTLKELKES